MKPIDPNAPAHTAEFTALDFETTGHVKGFPNEAWQIGLVRMCGPEIVPGTAFESLLHVAEDRPFNPAAPGRHARLRDKIAAAPPAAELWPQLAPELEGRVLVAHNIATERNILVRLAPMHRFAWVDTLRLARLAYPALESKALGDLAGGLGLADALDRHCPGREPHDALYDATACALFLAHLLAQPEWADLPLRALLHPSSAL